MGPQDAALQEGGGRGGVLCSRIATLRLSVCLSRTNCCFVKTSEIIPLGAARAELESILLFAGFSIHQSKTGASQFGGR